MRLLGRALLALAGGLVLGLGGVVLLSPTLRSCARMLLRGGDPAALDPDRDGDEDARPNIVLRAPGGAEVPLRRAVDEGMAAAALVAEPQGF